MYLTKKNIESVYNKTKKRAKIFFKKNNYNAAIKEIEISARTAYLFNFFYNDLELEKLIQDLSLSILSAKKHLLSTTKKIVFYDAFGYANRGLTQQYIRAFNELGYDYLYIYERKNSHLSKEIDKDLANSNGLAKVYELDNSLSPSSQIKLLYDVINNYNPSKIFLHIAPWSIMALCVFYAMPHIKRYNINLTDHAFWLGTGCLDYNIEFRAFGGNISLKKRNLENKQLIYLPYYPISNNTPFKGFPINKTEENIIIFSGGTFYKIYGHNKFYFTLVKNILDENPNAYLVYAGEGDGEPLKKFIEKNNYKNRFFLLGNRSDINEVFKACDIYMSTYPFTGGLMSQYAAINKKPILAYSSVDMPSTFVEDIICYKSKKTISYTDLNDYLHYAKKLCQDKEYRELKGKELENCVISPTEFRHKLSKIINDETNTYIFPEIDINFNVYGDLYLEIENKFQNSFKIILLKKYRFRMIVLFPNFFLKSFFKILFEIFPLYFTKFFKKS